MMSIHIEKLQEAVPDYTTMWWRLVKVKVHLNPEVNLEKDVIPIAVDSTGIKVTNGGEWIREKWNNNNKSRGFIKIHVAVNVRTKKILSMEVTKEDVYDGKMLKKLVDNVVSENNYVKKVLADDGAYDSKDNFRYIDKMYILIFLICIGYFISAFNSNFCHGSEKLQNEIIKLSSNSLPSW